MRIVRCPKCGKDVTIDVSKSVDENGEIYRCDACGMKFEYINSNF